MKFHYVYYAIKEDGTPKVGASSNLKERVRTTKYQSIKVLEQYDCPWKCGDREWELQLEYFGKKDSGTHYAITLKMKKVKGEKHGHTRLVSSQVSEIKQLYKKHIKGIRKNSTTKTLTRKDLANIYDVSLACIRDICEGKSWKHVK